VSTIKTSDSYNRVLLLFNTQYVEMKIAFVGDVHCHYELLHDLDVDMILQVGDFGIYPRPDKIDPKTLAKNDATVFMDYWKGKRKFKIPIFFVRGNHEDNEFLLKEAYKLRNEKTGIVELLPNLYWITDGRIFLYEDLAILGMGGIHATGTWDLTVSQRKGKRFNHFSKFDFAVANYEIDVWLDSLYNAACNYTKIFISHDAPTHEPPPGIKLYSHFGGCKPIADLVKRWDPVVARFGHYHYNHQIDLPNIDAKIMKINSVEIVEL
jgi:Icc-related predicted phosphoesterase